MKLFKLKSYKNKFKNYSISFPEYSLNTFNINNFIDTNLKKKYSVISFKKFKVDEIPLTIQQIKAEILKLKKKFNLIHLKYKDLSTKDSKKGNFKIYLNSPLITQINP